MASDEKRSRSRICQLRRVPPDVFTRQHTGSLRNCVSGFGPTDITRIDAIVYALFDLMTQNYIRLYLPRLYLTIQALAAMVADPSGLADDPYSIERFFTAVAKAEKLSSRSPSSATRTKLRARCADENRAETVLDRAARS
jgi:hypothetical protein